MNTLFDDVSSPGARPTDPATSKAAASLDRSTLRERVLAALVAHRDWDSGGGLTDDELARLMPDEHAGSVAKRRTDLRDLGLVTESSRTRTTRAGCDAIVWAVTGDGYFEAQRRGLTWAGPRLADVERRDVVAVLHERLDELQNACPVCAHRATSHTGLLQHLHRVHGCDTSRDARRWRPKV